MDSELGLGWTPDRTEQAVKLWRGGASAAQIARAVGGHLSRSAVIGKLHRMGAVRSEQTRSRILSSGTEGRIAANLRAIRNKAVKPKAAQSAPKGFLYINQGAVRERAPDVQLPAPRVETLAPTSNLMALTFSACRWPIGDPQAADFGFCGRPRSGEASSYCEAHRRASIGEKIKANAADLIRSCRRYA